MTAGGVKLRLCPFCGAAGSPQVMSSGAAAFVRCKVCRTEGPWYDICEYLPDDFHDMNGGDQDREWINATIAAKHSATIDWNRRPWEGSFFPEDLERMEEKMEQEADI